MGRTWKNFVEAGKDFLVGPKGSRIRTGIIEGLVVLMALTRCDPTFAENYTSDSRNIRIEYDSGSSTMRVNNYKTRPANYQRAN